LIDPAKRLFALLASLLIVAAIVFAVPWISSQLRIDSCLDHGSRWDYKQDLCDEAPKTDVPLGRH
jgi:hypothetical protein